MEKIGSVMEKNRIRDGKNSDPGCSNTACDDCPALIFSQITIFSKFANSCGTI
jgi:hypothetical protein